MRTFTLYAVGMLASAGIVFSAPIACPTNATLATLIALPTTGPDAGCQSQDKIFSDFAYTGGGGITATDVLAGLVFQHAGVSTDIHGWNFIPAGGTWTVGFTLSFTIAIAPGNPNLSIFASKDQIDSGFVPNRVVVTDVQTGVGTLTMDGLPGLETTQVLYPGLQSVSTVATAVIPSGSGLLSLEQEWFEKTAVATVPEPAPMFLLGVGLVGLSMLHRRQRRG